MPDQLPRSKRLNGVVILLLCGIPQEDEGSEEISDEEVREREDQITRVSEAVISLSRSVFSEGGRLALADDPLFTPLIAQIASEYWEPMPLETPLPHEERRAAKLEPVIVYDPRKELKGKGDFSRSGYVRVQPKVPSELTAVIAIGGSEKQFEEFGAWSDRTNKIPLYVVASTGGLAESYAEKSSMSETSDDSRLWRKIEAARKEMKFPAPEQLFRDQERERTSTEEQVPEFRYSIYPLLMSNIIDEVARRLRR